jgi:hypothetical protein
MLPSHWHKTVALLQHSWANSFFYFFFKCRKNVSLRRKFSYERAFVRALKWHRAVVVCVPRISASLRRVHTQVRPTVGEREKKTETTKTRITKQRDYDSRLVDRSRKLSLCVESLRWIIASQYLDGGPDGSSTIWPTSMFLPVSPIRSSTRGERVSAWYISRVNSLLAYTGALLIPRRR